MLGLLTLALATFLIANTMSALMARQVPAIGVMKTVGAGRGQLVGLFLLIPLVYGVVALALALPLSEQLTAAERGALIRELTERPLVSLDGAFLAVRAERAVRASYAVGKRRAHRQFHQQ